MFSLRNEKNYHRITFYTHPCLKLYFYHNILSFLNKASLNNETGTGGALVKQPVTYEDYMKLLWTNTGTKTKDHLDKLLNTFCSAYEKFEDESIPSLAVGILKLHEKFYFFLFVEQACGE